MKKILTAGLLALSAALITDHEASAWVNCKFGVGLNWNWQSGGNNFLWGAFRNGQPPCPDGCCPGYGGGAMYGGGGGGQQTFPGFQRYGPQDFQYFGRNGNTAPGQNPGQNAPAAAPAATQPAANGQVSWYGNSAYQPVGYSYTNNPYSYYSYPQNYYGYQVPSYWYGR